MQSVVTPTSAKAVGDESIDKAFVSLTLEGSGAPLSAGDVVFIMYMNNRVRVGYYNGANGVNASNDDSISFSGGVFTIDADSATNFRSDLTYKALAF